MSPPEKQGDSGAARDPRHDVRYAALEPIAREFLAHRFFANAFRLNRQRLHAAVQSYWSELPRIKAELEIDRLDRHKVGALTTLLVYRARPVEQTRELSTNAYASLIHELFSFYIGFSRVAKPSVIVELYPESLSSIISQLSKNQATLLGLSHEYFLMEELIRARGPSVPLE